MKIGIKLLPLIFFAAPLFAAQNEIPLKQLQPTKEQRQSALIINNVVSRYHYKRSVLDDKMSADILKRYIESLDVNKRYFTQQDIDRFTSKYNYKIDDSLRGADLKPAFEIFKVYRKRVEERQEHALKQLESDFNFGLDESYRFDREDEPLGPRILSTTSCRRNPTTSTISPHLPWPTPII